MKELIKTLHADNYSCVVRNFDNTYTFYQRGVTDLYDMVKNKPGFLKDAFIADKVVGKAAAALMILGGVKEVYADVVSLSALMLLREAGIEADFGRVVPFIQNREKTRWCPMERKCYNTTSARAILPLIEEFIKERNKQVTINKPMLYEN